MLRKPLGESPSELLATLVGEEGPAMTLFVEMAAKYGLPIQDGNVPLATELNVMLSDWQVHLLDITKIGFKGAIGYKRNSQPLVIFGFWPRAPQGCDEPGHFNVFDHDPLIEVRAGRTYRSFACKTAVLSAIVHVDDCDFYGYSATADKKVWTVTNEIVSRALELSEEFGYFEFDALEFDDKKRP
jgi:hypothetical protein